MTNHTTLTLRSPEDVLAMVATVFGFHPADSLVLVSRTDAASFHARIDLPVERSALNEVTGYLCDAAVRNGSREAALVAYTSDHPAGAAAVSALAASLDEVGVPVALGLREHGGFWFRLDEESGSLGTPYDLQAHPLLLQSRFEDREIFADRAALAGSLRGPDEEIAAVDAELDPAAERLLDAAAGRPTLDAVRGFLVSETAWLDERLDLGVRLTAAEIARLCLAISFVEVRDHAWAMVAPSSARQWAETWRAIVRQVPESVLAPPASLLGFAAWLSGDGALAWCAIDLARSADPDYSLANLLAEALEGAVPPSAWIPPEEFSRGDEAV